ncbi:GNAT family N-acetyltransferase [Phaeovulum sp. W22_SRMD_FR3]|uniref:GNAT family N-acetyltransferase n=1 Tax=Phaeovulum sp. W22_SRMD_FR3 TaxID=3240274 RepID=UPI003F98A9E1
MSEPIPEPLSAPVLRRAVAADADGLAQVMFRAIHAAPSPYTKAERAAWLPQPHAGPDWAARLAAQTVVVAQGRAGILGFLSLDTEGYVDLAFILPEARGSGLFRALHSQIEAEAWAAGLPRLYTHASLMAEPAFRACGYRLLEREGVARGDQVLRRALMEKPLAG